MLLVGGGDKRPGKGFEDCRLFVIAEQQQTDKRVVRSDRPPAVYLVRRAGLEYGSSWIILFSPNLLFRAAMWQLSLKCILL